MFKVNNKDTRTFCSTIVYFEQVFLMMIYFSPPQSFQVINFVLVQDMFRCRQCCEYTFQFPSGRVFIVINIS